MVIVSFGRFWLLVCPLLLPLAVKLLLQRLLSPCSISYIRPEEHPPSYSTPQSCETCSLTPSPVNRKAAIALLIYTIYRALTAELDSILEPPVSRKTLNDDIKRIAKKTVVPYSAASHYFPQGVQGMGHIYSPDEVVIKGGRGNAQIPIVAVPPPVLMTTDNGYYTGVGEELDPRMG